MSIELRIAVQKAQQAIKEYRELQDLVECCNKLIVREYKNNRPADMLYEIRTGYFLEMEVKRAEIRQFDPSFERGAE